MRFASRRLKGIFLLAISCVALCSAQTTVEEHWSPYNYPREIPAGAKYHTITDGDTLWSITATYLGDPLLWPQVYAKNAYILDPDLIYPGDPVFLDIGVVVGDETLSQEITDDPTVADSGEFADPDGTEGEAGDGMPGDEMEDNTQGEEEYSNVSEVTSFDADDAEFVILPAGDRNDMECSTYLYPLNDSGEVLPFDFKVSGGENRIRTSLETGAVVYLNKGISAGVAAGEIYSVRRALDKVYSPDRRFLGRAIDQVGRVKILAVQETSATALIMAACFEVRPGDFLVPYEQEPIPLITELPKTERYAPFDNKGHGYIVYSEDRLGAFGKGHTVNIDMGIDRNIAPGDLFLIYRDNPSNSKENSHLPDIFLGHGVALKAGPTSTVVKVISAVMEMSVGDKVVPINPTTFTE